MELGVYSGVSIRTAPVRITPEILALIAEIDEFKGAWRALGTIAPEHSVRILDHVREHGRVSIGEMAKLTGVSRNTLKEHFRQLVEKGYLSKRGGGRSTWYVLS